MLNLMPVDAGVVVIASRIDLSRTGRNRAAFGRRHFTHSVRGKCALLSVQTQ